ncbi:MAG: NUDIX domain-containing protein [Patescibacteria group bacterium]
MQIECLTITGDKKLISSEKLIFRPAAYAVIVNDGKILLARVKRSGKYWFPGGAVDLGETLKAAAKREVKEEAGIEIEVEKFLDFREVFFYAEREDKVFHNFSFFYLCKPKTLDLMEDGDVDGGIAERPQWIDIKTLSEGDMQPGAEGILDFLVK